MGLVVIKCNVLNSICYPVVTVFRHSKFSRLKRKTFSKFPGSLEILRAAEEDESNYECYALNSIGISFSQPAQLVIKGRFLVLEMFLRTAALPHLVSVNAFWKTFQTQEAFQS